MDRLTALRVFRLVAELSSFAEAGRRLGLSPAAISKNIAELEAHVGARLINRTTRRMALTEEGRLYLEHVTRGLDALAEADQALWGSVVISTLIHAKGILQVTGNT